MKYKKLTIVALLSSQLLALSVDATTTETKMQGYEQTSATIQPEETVSEDNQIVSSAKTLESFSNKEAEKHVSVAAETLGTFLTNWEYTEETEKLILTKYIGTEKEIVVPARINGKQVALKAIDEEVIPRDIKKFAIDAQKDQTVQLDSKTLAQGFRNCRDLTEVDFRGLDTSEVVSMAQLFENCSNLKSVDLSECQTEKVTTMEAMFKNCSDLAEVQLANLNVSAVETMNQLFFGCERLIFIDLSDFSLNEHVLTNQMFTTKQPAELLVLAKDSQLLAQDPIAENRLPLSGPELQTKSGDFTNHQSIKKYFEKCIYLPEKLSMEEFETFKAENEPKRTDFATHFMGWEPTKELPASVENVLDVLTINYEAKWQDPNWDFEETDSEIILKKYKGADTELVVPGEINGKQVVLMDINTTVIPSTTTSFKAEEKNNKKVKIKDSDLVKAFHNNKVLTEVDLRGLDTSNITSFQALCKDCSNLKTVKMNELDVSQVKSFQSMFYECQKLTEADLSNLNSTSVSDMSNLFYNCYNLENIDLSNMKTTAVTTMSKMFFNCFINKDISELDLSSFQTPVLTNTNRMFNGAKLPKILRLDNMELKKGADTGAMFYGNKQEVVVVTKSPVLLAYNFQTDLKSPLSSLIFDANGGSIEDQTKIHYFESCAVTPEQLTLEAFNQFKDELMPERAEAEFRGWQSNEPEESESVLDLLDCTYTAEWKTMSCNTSEDNRKVTTSGPIGFTYLPEKFKLPSVGLFDFGEQVIPFTKEQSLNIGIRDISRSKSHWQLSGRLNWNGQAIPGAMVQLDKDANNLKKNKNDNIKDFEPASDLVDAEGEVVFADQSNATIRLVANEITPIFEANKDKSHDDIYDYNLGEASLVIPSAEYARYGSVDANVEWRLMDVPQ
ncbi:BspA family leucine-rich repeat surface protein [Enterococcus gallinarum]|uniref:BspA family leucine-rich repeat surface protein n=1 Tax=Enterococcus gallinarum TaxID=1353 RepID=UPI001D171FDB|nr:BspA family leucine-rich repeat surface protein [Enterococcus gallinarum]MCC4045677.1 BspA family leucine-rich repeat surface protein [Enterococcus gallinarum]